MINKELYHQLYITRKYPPEFEEYLFHVLLKVNEIVSERLNKSNGIFSCNVDPVVSLRYVVEEHIYNMSLIEKVYVDKFLKTKEYYDHLVRVVSDKVFFNEYLEYHAVSYISKYNPLISTLELFLNYIINKYEQLPSNSSIEPKIKLDILKKGFFMIKSVLNLLCDGYETEAFSTWRTIHEVECVAKILDEKPYLTESYYLHMHYNSIYRGGEKDKEKVDAFYEEVKGKLKKWDLKSKDFKKFLEYGWLFDIKNWKEEYPELKLNFRKGLEYVAGLGAYSNLYESSSEIAHGSPLLIYSSKPYYLNITIMCLYETFIRMESMFAREVEKVKDIDSTAYFGMRNIYIPEVRKNILKLKLLLDYHNSSDDE